MLAENLVSKNNLLSPNCFWTEQINGVVKNMTQQKSKFKRKSALKINERIMLKKLRKKCNL